jgi:hypothetical protein
MDLWLISYKELVLVMNRAGLVIKSYGYGDETCNWVVWNRVGCFWRWVMKYHVWVWGEVRDKPNLFIFLTKEKSLIPCFMDKKTLGESDLFFSLKKKISNTRHPDFFFFRGRFSIDKERIRGRFSIDKERITKIP